MNVFDASLVIEKVNHLLAEIFAASVPLKPEPVIHEAVFPQVTPAPRDIWENVKPVGGVEIVATGLAGQVGVVNAV